MDSRDSCVLGDAVAATLLEADEEQDLLGFDLGSDGKGWDNLIVPVGQSRYRTLEDLPPQLPRGLAAIAHPEHLSMNGPEIFAFTVAEVPGIVRRALANSGRTPETLDYFFFHQANKFIQDHLVRKTQLPPAKCPVSLDCYGNTSGASPAVTACHTAVDANRQRELSAMFVGFGIGYSWGAVVCRLRPGTVLPIEEVGAERAGVLLGL